MTIPPSIRYNIIYEWLCGIKRDKIAANNHVSTGAVSSIIKEERSQMPYINLLRALAVKLGNQGQDPDSFAFAVRLQNQLKSLGINEEAAELVIENVHVHCFTRNIEISDYLTNFDYLVNFAKNKGFTIEQLENDVFEKENQLKYLDMKIQEMITKRNDLASVYKTTVKDLEEFMQLRPIHEKLIKAEKELVKKDLIIQQKEYKISELKSQLEKFEQNSD